MDHQGEGHTHGDSEHVHHGVVAVQARDLRLGYGSTIVLDRSSFLIPCEGLTVVIGPNGSGKTTLLDAIAGLLTPLAGTLDVPAREDGSSNIAYVLQSTSVNEALPITVREVVTMGRYTGPGYRRLTEADHRAVDRALQRTGVLDLAGRRLHHLSDGQRQRVFVAQGLAQDHEVLLLDEPMTGIDLPAAQAIDQVIHEERRHNCAVIMTTHDLSEARVADYVLLLAGRVVASGPPGEALTPQTLAEAYGAGRVHQGDGHRFLNDPSV